MRKFGILVAALSIIGTAAPVLAHHGFDTEYDANKHVKLEGVVTQVSWTNPHMRVYIDVKDPTGREIGFEVDIATLLARQLGRADQVSEENSRHLALFLGTLRVERRPACKTEAGFRRILLAAPRTRRHPHSVRESDAPGETGSPLEPIGHSPHRHTRLTVRASIVERDHVSDVGGAIRALGGGCA